MRHEDLNIFKIYDITFYFILTNSHAQFLTYVWLIWK